MVSLPLWRCMQRFFGVRRQRLFGGPSAMRAVLGFPFPQGGLPFLRFYQWPSVGVCWGCRCVSGDVCLVICFRREGCYVVVWCGVCTIRLGSWMKGWRWLLQAMVLGPDLVSPSNSLLNASLGLSLLVVLFWWSSSRSRLRF